MHRPQVTTVSSFCHCRSDLHFMIAIHDRKSTLLQAIIKASCLLQALVDAALLMMITCNSPRACTLECRFQSPCHDRLECHMRLTSSEMCSCLHLPDNYFIGCGVWVVGQFALTHISYSPCHSKWSVYSLAHISLRPQRDGLYP